MSLAKSSWLVGCLLVWALAAAVSEGGSPASGCSTAFVRGRECRRVSPARWFSPEIVASEPLIAEPSGVAFGCGGRCLELHGYNVEGQLDIEELNKTGKLDTTVRRLDASPAIKQAAANALRGTVKLLLDTDGDVINRPQVWADQLPPCYGICPARDGIIVACAGYRVFGRSRWRRTGGNSRSVVYRFRSGRRLGAASIARNRALDDWIICGRGHGGGHITGPHLAQPVDLPNTDFRLKADGTAIEPVSGGTRTIGFVQGPAGGRLVATTNVPGIAVTPIDWRYLARNPDAAIGALEQPAADYNRCYPASKPHPCARGEQRIRPSPSFTPIVTAYPIGAERILYVGLFAADLSGHHTSRAGRPISDLRAGSESGPSCDGGLAGTAARLSRLPVEATSEFLTSTDPWFHPISLAPAPDGCLLVTDFYREIIEDYSAIPRYLQQQYELTHGQDRGRLWRLAHRDATGAGGGHDGPGRQRFDRPIGQFDLLAGSSHCAAIAYRAPGCARRALVPACCPGAGAGYCAGGAVRAGRFGPTQRRSGAGRTCPSRRRRANQCFETVRAVARPGGNPRAGPGAGRQRPAAPGPASRVDAG